MGCCALMQGAYSLTRKMQIGMAIHIIFATALGATMGAHDLEVFGALQLKCDTTHMQLGLECLQHLSE